MKPDLGLREFIATKVMGWSDADIKRWRKLAAALAAHRKTYGGFSRLASEQKIESLERSGAKEMPAYELSIEAAMQVVEEMRGKAWIEIIADPTGYRVDSLLGNHGLALKLEEVPRALCLAAKAAIEAEGGK